MSSTSPKSFADLLQSAVNEPGILSQAYRQFHGYSFGNRLLAFYQCKERGIQPGPIATYPRWKELGRHVKRGEKAIVLCMPVTVKRAPGAVQTDTDDGSEDKPEVFTRFVYRPNWFTLAQTEGEPLPEPTIPDWDRDRALTALDVHEVPFDDIDGNCLGFARGREIAINPINPMPAKTRFHEIAHVLLHHSPDSTQSDSETTPRNLRECEAEAVAMLCCAALGLPGIEESRGYIQAWYGSGNAIPERSAQRTMKVADQILRSGRGEEVRE